MKNISILIFVILSIFLFTTCGEETQENHTNTIENPKKTYLDSRVDARGLAKKSVNESNKRIEEQDKAMEALTK